MIQKIKKIIFTNIIIENIIIQLLKFKFKSVKRLIPGNDLYKKNTIRRVKRDNLIFTLDLSDYQEHLIYFYLDIDSSKPMLKYIPKKNSQIIDIGANIGQTSLYIAQHLRDYNCEIYAFEPFPSTFKKLTQNINDNEFKNIKLFNQAVGNSNSEINMVEACETNSGSYRNFSSNDSSEKSKTLVKQIKLDQQIESFNFVNFIKIDVEGYEFEVLKGAEEIIKKMKPLLFVELNDTNLKNQNSSAIEVLNFIKQLGYNKILQAETDLDIHTINLENCSMDIFCSWN